ncbi:receptor-transporting protein 3-like [Parambassis ranga]|uniref:Receptor-transporting protein 3-like n=1 Tax=Parambassis ranga TaxID=210632 RepID=A0A6P7I2E5_9TELE|nr:receptor-transporting protein 3-like [Parambassis ranga]
MTVPPEWVLIFLEKTLALPPGHRWVLDFDDHIEPDHPNSGWKKYIRNTSARFKCSKCGRSWPSNRVMVVFHMCLIDTKGVVKVRIFRQKCKNCSDAQMEKPSIDSENIKILLENLVEKIRRNCYFEDIGSKNRNPKSIDVKSPHEPDHCEACMKGVCTRNDASAVFKPDFY